MDIRTKPVLLARGFEQHEAVDEIYAHVAKMSSLQIFLALSCSRGYDIHQMMSKPPFYIAK